MGSMLLTWSVLLLGTTTDDALPPWARTITRPTCRSGTSGDRRRTGRVRRGPGRHDGRRAIAARPRAVWTPFEQTWESNRAVRLENVGETDVVNPWLSNGRNDFRSVERDRGPGHRAGHDRQGEGHRALVAADSTSLPLRRRQQRAARSRQGLQRLWPQHLRQRFHLPGRPVEHGGPEGGPGPPGRPLRHAGLLRRRAGTSSTATCTRCICCATTRRSPASRTSCATTT